MLPKALEFELVRNKAGNLSFRIVAPSGEVLAHGDAFPTDADVFRAVEQIQDGAPGSRIVVRDEAAA